MNTGITLAVVQNSPILFSFFKCRPVATIVKVERPSKIIKFQQQTFNIASTNKTTKTIATILFTSLVF